MGNSISKRAEVQDLGYNYAKSMAEEYPGAFFNSGLDQLKQYESLAFIAAKNLAEKDIDWFCAQDLHKIMKYRNVVIPAIKKLDETQPDKILTWRLYEIKEFQPYTKNAVELLAHRDPKKFFIKQLWKVEEYKPIALIAARELLECDADWFLNWRLHEIKVYEPIVMEWSEGYPRWFFNHELDKMSSYKDLGRKLAEKLIKDNQPIFFDIGLDNRSEYKDLVSSELLEERFKTLFFLTEKLKENNISFSKNSVSEIEIESSFGLNLDEYFKNNPNQVKEIVSDPDIELKIIENNLNKNIIRSYFDIYFEIDFDGKIVIRGYLSYLPIKDDITWLPNFPKELFATVDKETAIDLFVPWYKEFRKTYTVELNDKGFVIDAPKEKITSSLSSSISKRALHNFTQNDLIKLYELEYKIARLPDSPLYWRRKEMMSEELSHLVNKSFSVLKNAYDHWLSLHGKESVKLNDPKEFATTLSVVVDMYKHELPEAKPQDILEKSQKELENSKRAYNDIVKAYKYISNGPTGDLGSDIATFSTALQVAHNTASMVDYLSNAVKDEEGINKDLLDKLTSGYFIPQWNSEMGIKNAKLKDPIIFLGVDDEKIAHPITGEMLMLKKIYELEYKIFRLKSLNSSSPSTAKAIERFEGELGTLLTKALQAMKEVYGWWVGLHKNLDLMFSDEDLLKMVKKQYPEINPKKLEHYYYEYASGMPTQYDKIFIKNEQDARRNFWSTPPFSGIYEMYKMLQGGSRNAADDMVLFQRALTTVHQGGPMLNHFADKTGISQKLLDDLSAGNFIEGWDKEIVRFASDRQISKRAIKINRENITREQAENLATHNPTTFFKLDLHKIPEYKDFALNAAKDLADTFPHEFVNLDLHKISEYQDFLLPFVETLTEDDKGYIDELGEIKKYRNIIEKKYPKSFKIFVDNFLKERLGSIGFKKRVENYGNVYFNKDILLDLNNPHTFDFPGNVAIIKDKFKYILEKYGGFLPIRVWVSIKINNDSKDIFISRLYFSCSGYYDIEYRDFNDERSWPNILRTSNNEINAMNIFIPWYENFEKEFVAISFVGAITEFRKIAKISPPISKFAKALRNDQETPKTTRIVNKSLDINNIKNFIKVPLTFQSTEFSCGAAAIQSVLRYYGAEFKEKDLIEHLKTNPQTGTRYDSLVEFAKKYGLEVNVISDMTTKQLKSFIDAKRPVMVDFQAWADIRKNYDGEWQDGHYALVIGYDKENIYFMDPFIFGNYSYMPETEFESRWHDRHDGDNAIKLNHLGIVFGYNKPPRYNPDAIIKLEQISKRAKDPLAKYKSKRDFEKTPEPEGKVEKGKNQYRYVIQEHDATNLHWDLRLENDEGSLSSFAIPKARIPKGKEKLLAIKTEDHPIEYLSFNKEIKEGYGAGTVKIIAKGRYRTIKEEKNKILFSISSGPAKGCYSLIHTDGDKWLWSTVCCVEPE